MLSQKTTDFAQLFSKLAEKRFCSTFLKSWKARVAEWFKATDLRPVIYDAWVRTPPRAQEVYFENTKREFPHFFFMPNWLNWIERKTSNLEVEGSSPLLGL